MSASVDFTTIIKQFDEQGEKTGWTYILIPSDLAEKLCPGNRKGFRVKGKFDEHPIKSMALIPMGAGNFIIPLNAQVRKAIGKRKGAMLRVRLEIDKRPQKISKEFLDCLSDEPNALAFFDSLPNSHKLYFSKWIETAKTEPTKTKRIAQSVDALSKKFRFNEMLRSLKENRKDSELP